MPGRTEPQIARQGRPFRSKSLPAIVATTRAGDRCIRTDDHVTELARGTTFATIDLALQDDAGTDSSRHQDEDEVARIADLGPPEPQFCKRDCMGVVVYGNCQASSTSD